MPDRFPQEAVLRDGRRLMLRLFTANDVDALYHFFQHLPKDVRRFAWDRIDSHALVETWGREVRPGAQEGWRWKSDWNRQRNRPSAVASGWRCSGGSA